MTPTPTTTVTLADAITTAEQASKTYSDAVAQTVSDQAIADAAQAKADTAKGVVATDQTNQGLAASGYVGALQGLVNVAQAQIAALAPGNTGATGN